MEDDVSNPFRRMSMRTRKIAPKMAAALASNDNRTQAAIARLEALENDYTGMETVEAVDDDEASLDDDDDVEENVLRYIEGVEVFCVCVICLCLPLSFYLLVPVIYSNASSVLARQASVYIQKKQKGTKRKTRQAKALENARKAPRNFLELLHEANLEALPPHIPSYLRAAVGPPSSTCRRHFCTVCGFTSNYTCAKCGMRFCSIRCQKIHDDTRCQKFVA
ncbi:hypothetical protein NC652_031921 [Populus alba x Populus x berolinensis]|uniref:HIT-type domain-containing protein n=1 Tax=Populus alba x Populus x berolinensis TaxID=444605 RepID=A0AAD6LZJ2_9ROSI|nr:hypothetical protein NC652_031919 [Populus alba x Populus x berolinensis]KAJ6885062.1 hypothetical protein NC652_031921 [Populus alba x Populus x berolinensis]KAJ6976002.1 hypothetical protein NC653_031740 [Populus alba x Populus x berolinensis]KAJ6976010.1 hypothetical protein NC653_031745 [Populus alba x Populus x berolinensis]